MKLKEQNMKKKSQKTKHGVQKVEYEMQIVEHKARVQSRSALVECWRKTQMSKWEMNSKVGSSNNKRIVNKQQSAKHKA